MYNAGERKDVRQAEKAAKLADQQRREVITGVMATLPGRAWVFGLLEACHIFQTSFNVNPIGMAFNEGQRDVGLRLLNDIMQSCPDQYVLMMRESNERRSASERTSSQNGDGRDQGPDASDDSIYGDEADGDSSTGREALDS